MTNERWEQIQTIYHRAKQLPLPELDQFLAGACSSDRELRREVESLLASSKQSLGFVAKAMSEAAAEIRGSQRNSGALRSRRPPWWMYFIVTSFAAMHVLILYVTIWGTTDIDGLDAGFEDGVMQMHRVEPGSHLALAGLDAGDRIIAIDDRPVRNPRDWNIAQSNRDPVRPQRWEILRGAERLELKIDPGRSPLINQFRTGLIGYNATAITCFLLGLLMAFQRPSDSVARGGRLVYHGGLGCLWNTQQLGFCVASASHPGPAFTMGSTNQPVSYRRHLPIVVHPVPAASIPFALALDGIVDAGVNNPSVAHYRI